MTDTPKPLTADEIADLLAKAEAATPGPWFTTDAYQEIVGNDGRRVALTDARRKEYITRANTDYIAVANPDTVQRAIATIEQQREQIEKLRHLLAFINRGIGKGVIKDQTILLPCSPDAAERPMQALSDAIDEALASTEPPK